MTKWELGYARTSDHDGLDKLCAEGWEPFACEAETEDHYGRMWFRRQVTAYEQVEIPTRTGAEPIVVTVPKKLSAREAMDEMAEANEKLRVSQSRNAGKPSGICSHHRDGEDLNCRTCYPLTAEMHVCVNPRHDPDCDCAGDLYEQSKQVTQDVIAPEKGEG